MLQASTTTFVTKLGTTRAGENSRIWIEGARLLAAGFSVGDKFQKLYGAHSVRLTAVSEAVFNKLPAAERGTVSGKGDKPIIDIVGVKVIETFAPGTHVTVTYKAGLISIKRIEGTL